MRCSDIMKTDVQFLEPDDSCETAARTMRDLNIGFLPVCDPDGKVVGTLTDRDICIRLVAANRPGSTQVDSVMTPDVVSCLATDDLRRAEELMRQHQVSRMICLSDDGTIAGVISLSDILDADREQAADTAREIASRESLH